MIEYTRIITDEEQKILEHDLLDIRDWIDKAIAGKINNCAKRAAREYDQFASTHGIDMIPAKEDQKRAALFAHPEYKNRLERETQDGIQKDNTITEIK